MKIKVKCIFVHEAKDLDKQINNFFEEENIGEYTLLDIKPLGEKSVIITYKTVVNKQINYYKPESKT